MVQEEQVRQRAACLLFFSPLHASMRGELLKLDHVSFLDTRYASFTAPLPNPRKTDDAW